MTTIIHMVGNCGVTLWDNEEKWDASMIFHDINDALTYLREMIDTNAQAIGGQVYEYETGNILATCALEDESNPDKDYDAWDDWGYNEDMGYDPYMGCYTDDC